MTAPSRLGLGYVVRRFPSLTQSFVLNEIRALERHGARVHVFSALPPKGADPVLVHASAPSDRTRVLLLLDPLGPRQLAAALAWILVRHPVRLFRTLMLTANKRRKIRIALLGKALFLSWAAGAIRISHLHAHLGLASDIAWLTHHMTGIGFSFTAHARDIYVANHNLDRKLADASFVVTVCDYNRVKLVNLHPPAADKIHVIHPFLDQRFLQQRSRLRGDGIGQRPLRILCVCRLIPKKGVDVLLDALYLLRERSIQVHATILGDGPERKHLEDQVRDLGLAAIASLPGSRDVAAVDASLSMSDCFVLAARPAADGDSDATPTVLGEAMAAELPVVSTRLAGIPEIVPEGAGILVAHSDPEALAEAIAEIAAMTPQQLRAMGERGRAFVQTHWNGSRDVRRLICLFRKATQRATDRRASCQAGSCRER